MGIGALTNKSFEHLANLATRASEALPNVDPTPSTVTIDPTEKGALDQQLSDFRLPQSLTSWLSLPLASLGFSLTSKDETRNQFIRARPYSLIENRAGQLALLHINKEILSDGNTWEYVAGIITLGLKIRKQILLVISENLDRTDINYSQMGRDLFRDEYDIEWVFVPWGDLEQAKTFTTDKQATLVAATFHLNPLMVAAQNLPLSTKLTMGDIATIADIFGRVPQFSDSGDKTWRLLLEQAGLRQFVGYFPPKVQAKYAAFELLDKLKDLPPISDFPKDQVIGLLLCQALVFLTIDDTDCVIIKKIVTKYSLAPTKANW